MRGEQRSRVRRQWARMEGFYSDSSDGRAEKRHTERQRQGRVRAGKGRWREEKEEEEQKVECARELSHRYWID